MSLNGTRASFRLRPPRAELLPQEVHQLRHSLGVPIVLIGLLFGAATHTVESAKGAGEAVKVWREAKKVQLENRKLELEIEEVQRRINALPSPLQHDLDQSLREFGSVKNDPQIRHIDVDLEPGAGEVRILRM